MNEWKKYKIKEKNMCLAHSRVPAVSWVNCLCFFFPESLTSNKFQKYFLNNNWAVITLSSPGRLSTMCLVRLTHLFVLFFLSSVYYLKFSRSTVKSSYLIWWDLYLNYDTWCLFWPSFNCVTFIVRETQILHFSKKYLCKIKSVNF